MATILIVDDELGLLEMLEIVLTRSGYEVLTSDTEEGGLTLFRERAPDRSVQVPSEAIAQPKGA